MQKSQGYQLFLFINTTALSITIACIFLASTVALVTIKMSSDIASSVINGPQSHSIYLHLLKSANQSFISEDAIEEVAISDLAFKFATSITPEDHGHSLVENSLYSPFSMAKFTSLEKEQIIQLYQLSQQTYQWIN